MAYRLRQPAAASWGRLAAAILILLLLGGCAGHAPRSGGRGPATLRPYTIKGKTYVPLHSAQGFKEVGVASWYGPGFHGHTTSCGEIYDQNQMTCAHKLLPMHTLVRVTNLENGRSVELRVNDRGPFVSGRIVDLSLAGAKSLGLHAKGTARVRVEVAGEVPGAGPQDELPGPFYVQVGAFTQRQNADRLQARLLSAGYAGTRILDKETDGVRYFRVLAGVFPTTSTAEEARQRLGSTFRGAFVIAQ